MELYLKDRSLDLNEPKIMGILNVTPDSFSDGGRFQGLEQALSHAKEMLEAGASIIDIGGESTRPGSREISVDEELERVIPVVEKIAKTLNPIISIDTSSPEVIKEAVRVGAHIWNDIRSLSRPNALETALELNIPVCLMHMQGKPQTMQVNPHYSDVEAEVMDFLEQKTALLVDKGFDPRHILWDVGFGFGKSTDDNYRLLAHLEKFTAKGYPFVAALSRKKMIYAATGEEKASDRVIGSVTAALVCAQKGAQILRVHDVLETKKALQVLKLIKDHN